MAAGEMAEGGYGIGKGGEDVGQDAQQVIDALPLCRSAIGGGVGAGMVQRPDGRQAGQIERNGTPERAVVRRPLGLGGQILQRAGKVADGGDKPLLEQSRRCGGIADNRPGQPAVDHSDKAQDDIEELAQSFEFALEQMGRARVAQQGVELLLGLAHIGQGDAGQGEGRVGGEKQTPIAVRPVVEVVKDDQASELHSEGQKLGKPPFVRRHIKVGQGRHAPVDLTGRAVESGRVGCRCHRLTVSPSPMSPRCDRTDRRGCCGHWSCGSCSRARSE